MTCIWELLYRALEGVTEFVFGHEHLETTMKYLDITTEDKVNALATLEDEKEKSTSKKWKNDDGTLTDFCGLKR